MLLDPGPIPDLGSVHLDQSPLDATFEQYTLNTFTALDAYLVLMDAQIDPTIVFLDDLPDDGNGVILDGLDASIGDVASFVLEDSPGAIDQSFLRAQDNLVDAYRFTPAEVFGPTPDPGSFTKAGNLGGLPYTITAQIQNPDNPPAVAFFPGDRYQLQAYLSIHDPSFQNAFDLNNVTMKLVKNGDNQPSVPLVFDSSLGAFVYNSKWQSGDVGAWSAVPSFPLADGTGFAANTPTVVWQVLAPGPPPSGQPTEPFTVTLTFPSGAVKPNAPASNSVLHVGEQFTLSFKGAAFSQIIIDAELGGVRLAQVALGSTDSTGFFTLTAAVGTESIGTWSETYTLGGTAWGSSFNFIVAV